MQVVYKKRAINSLLSTAKFIESKNTSGAGERWLQKIKKQVNSLATSKVNLLFVKMKH